MHSYLAVNGLPATPTNELDGPVGPKNTPPVAGRIGVVRVSSGGKIRVALVDDQRLLTMGLASILHMQSEIEVVGQAHSGEEAVVLCLGTQPDVVLMDICMPGMGGIAATREIKSLMPEIRVLILTVYDDAAYALSGIKAGAQGYLLKDCTPDDLLHAIRGVYNGETVISSDVAAKIFETSERPRSETGSPPRLSERELGLVKAMAQGQSNRQIAQTLGISEKTVRNHTTNIYRKLQVADRTQAVIYAIREGLVDMEELK